LVYLRIGLSGDIESVSMVIRKDGTNRGGVAADEIVEFDVDELLGGNCLHC
jgi:hypothetical protein